jgi:dGTPase
MDTEYTKRIEELEGDFERWAKRSTKSLGRKYPLSDSPFRTPFERDTHRILHSLPFRRLKHKTQVFFAPNNDHICTRIEHSLHVASIAVTVCKRLYINPTLAEAIALAHDLGHPPFGHLGEVAMRAICRSNSLPHFKHEAQSLRVIDEFQNTFHDRLNLTFEVRDGVVCHWGEKDESDLVPAYRKNIKNVDVTAARKQRPATIEGCVVRICDTISYLGRDFEDACMAGLLKEDDLPDEIKNSLGQNNSEIIGSLVDDLVENSLNQKSLHFSKKIYKAMILMKAFNRKKIYESEELVSQQPRISVILRQLFNHFSKDLENIKERHDDDYCRDFADFIKQMDYSDEVSAPQKVIDFLSGMTDNYALSCFESLIYVRKIV